MILRRHNIDTEIYFFRDLRHNRISSFTKYVFAPLKKLQVLYLNSNEIKSLKDGTIPKLENLITLSLADNQIKYIADDALILPSLEHL